MFCDTLFCDTLFCDTALAARIEAAETDLITTLTRAALARSGASGFVVPLAGGAATFAGADSPYSKVVGLGFGPSPSVAELEKIENAYAEHGAPVQVELSHPRRPRSRRAAHRPRLPAGGLRERAGPQPRHRFGTVGAGRGRGPDQP